MAELNEVRSASRADDAPAPSGPGRPGSARGPAGAVRATPAGRSRTEHDAPIVVAAAGAAVSSAMAVIDGELVAARLELHDAWRGILVGGAGVRPSGAKQPLSGPSTGDGPSREVVAGTERSVVLFPTGVPLLADGSVITEVVVDGWSIEVELEPESRAALRERAHRSRAVAGRSGPLLVRAIIPGRVVAVSIAQGDAVVAGQQLMVVEAMKMQNELRSPRDGTVTRIAVGPGTTIEVGDLLAVIE